MRSVVLALVAFAALAPAARADGLSASAGDRYGSTTGMVAGRPAVIVSTLYLSDSDDGCERPRDLRATLDPPRGIAVRGSRSLSPRARGGPRHDVMVNATWHVRAARAFSGGDFDADGLSCMLVQGARMRVAYRLRFTWNHAIGAATVVGSGSLPVVALARNDTERVCERQNRPTPESPCTPCESGDADVASMPRPMTAAAEQTTSRRP
jgi:hypothetical protein